MHEKSLIGSFTMKFPKQFYLIFRVVIGLLFFMHGAGKLFGWFGGNPVQLASLMGFAGIVEFFGGLAIALGLLTRLAAFGSLVIMAGAYITVHLPNGLNPLANKGELALVYFASFLIIFAYGAGMASLEKLLWKKEIF